MSFLITAVPDILRSISFADAFDKTAIASLPWVYMAFICVCFSTFITQVFALCKREKRNPNYLLAVLRVITTPAASWPWGYVPLIESCTTIIPKKKLIKLDLSNLIDLISSGSLELRNTKDLFHAFDNRLQFYDWNICVGVGSSWWFRVLPWVLNSALNTSQKATPKVIQHKGAPELPSHTTTVDLDFLPWMDIQRYLSNIQHSLAPKSILVLHFTSVDSRFSFLSSLWVLCCIPIFLYQSPDKSNSACRTSSPLFLQPSRVLSALFSHPGSYFWSARRSWGKTLEMCSLTNTSKSHAATLLSDSQNLIYDAEVRRKFIAQFGEHAWRQKILMLEWEAGLLKEGLMTRWSIILRGT